MADLPRHALSVCACYPLLWLSRNSLSATLNRRILYVETWALAIISYAITHLRSPFPHEYTFIREMPRPPRRKFYDYNPGHHIIREPPRGTLTETSPPNGQFLHSHIDFIYSAVLIYVVWEPFFVSALLRYIGFKVDPWNWSSSVTVDTLRRIKTWLVGNKDNVTDDRLLALVSRC